jgi:two-component system, sensor histidine kinase and response regulator
MDEAPMSVINGHNRRHAGGRFVSLRTKFVGFISLIIAGVCSGLSWYFIQQQTDSMTRALIDTGTILVRNLAHNSRYAVFTEDQVLLDQLANGVMQVEEIVYVVFTGPEGRQLAAKSKGTLGEGKGLTRSPTSPLYPPPDLAKVLFTPTPQELVISPVAAAGTQPPTGHGDVLYDFAVPVIRRSQPQPLVPRLALETQAPPPEMEPEGESPDTVYGVVQIGLSGAKMRLALNTVVWNVTLITLIVTLGGIVATIVLAGRIITPLRRLALAASRVAAGDLTASAEPITHDEVGQLASLFNHMTQSLKDRDLAISAHIQTITRQVKQLTALNQAGAAITSTLDIGRLLTTVLDLLVENVGFARMLLALYDRERQVAFGLRMAGVSEDAARAAHDLEIPVQDDGSLHAELLIYGKSILVPDINTVLDQVASHYLAMARQVGVTSFVCAPLRSKQRILGFIAADKGAQRCTQEDLDLLTTIAGHVAVAIDNALAYQQLEQLTQTLEQRVRERTLELQEANQRLEDASRHKSEFLANMSHELRTPMNAIIGFTRLVMRRGKDILPLRESDNLGKILISAEHLLALINDILDLSKIEAGHMEVHPVSFDMEPLIDECFRTIEPLAKSERLRLVHSWEADLPPLFTDQDKLKQILINLLSNAVKFTEAGTVTLSARCHAGEVAIAIADTGIGIPADKLELIFEEFRQLDSGTTRKYSGTGLGLSISRRLARLLGGDITVQSTVGVGSTFTVTLPCRYGAASPATRPTPASSAEVLPAAGEGEKIVLAIDDNPDVIYLLRESLAEAGYRLIGVASGEEGLQQARALRPFAIILDILMPYKDGWQVLHELKSHVATRAIPIIVLSVVDNRELGYRLGAFDYLLKPCDREAIIGALSRISPHQGRLLVVDDDPQVAALIRQLLAGEPYEIVAAADGQEALEIITRQPPEVILLDLLMPRMDGFTVIKHLQQDPQLRHIPVIVLTAKALTTVEHAVLEQRVRTVMQKQGLDRDALLHELRELLQAYHGSSAKR